MKYTLPEIQAAIAMSGQFNRLYITSKYRETFLIQVLPEGEKAKPDGAVNPCLNTNAVKVFEWRQGQATPFKNSWLFKGKWQTDFENLVESLLQEQADIEARRKKEALNLLSTYK